MNRARHYLQNLFPLDRESPIWRSRANRLYRTFSVGREVILLVEDEDRSPGDDSAASSRTSGYTVLEARDGKEAVADVHDPGKDPIDLLITDVVMPEMSGPQVAEVVTSHNRNTKVLYVSGYTDDAVVRHGVLQAKTAFLQKPFTISGLAKKVREVLDQQNVPS